MPDAKQPLAELISTILDILSPTESDEEGYYHYELYEYHYTQEWECTQCHQREEHIKDIVHAPVCSIGVIKALLDILATRLS